MEGKAALELAVPRVERLPQGKEKQMPLKVVDAGSLGMQTIVAMVAGYPNVGKSSLAMTCKDPLILAFDRGIYRAENRTNRKAVLIREWSEVSGMDKTDLEGVSTIVVDTVGKCVESMAHHIIRTDPKASGATGVVLNPAGWSKLRDMFGKWLERLRSYGLNIMLISHLQEESRGDSTVGRVAISGGD